MAGVQGMRPAEARLQRASNAMRRCLDKSIARSDECVERPLWEDLGEGRQEGH